MKKLLGSAAALVLAISVVATNAVAQTFSAPAATSPDTLVGDATSGSETGIFEYAGLILAVAAVGIVIVLLFKGWHLARRSINKVG